MPCNFSRIAGVASRVVAAVHSEPEEEVELFARRFFLGGLVASALTLATSSNGLAAGKGGGGGKGGSNSGGNSGNSGGNSGNGNGGGNGNSGNGNSGSGNSGTGNSGNGKGNSGTKGTGVGDDSATATSTENSSVSAPSLATTPATMSPARASLRVRHRNGFEEIMSGGRYHLKDNKGRTIVNRRATKADLARLRRLTGA